MRREPAPSISDPEAECSRGLIKNRARRYERRCFRRRQAGAQQAAIVALRLVICWEFMALSCSICLPGHALGGELVLYGAGSLREVMTQVAADYQATHGVQVRIDFGPSGLMRERIERGEKTA
jgi:Bacterial extracellular solute-binding protein